MTTEQPPACTDLLTILQAAQCAMAVPDLDMWNISECRLCLNGLFNTQGCQGAPAFGSGPHFLYGDSLLVEAVEGLKPEAGKHSTFLNIEPLSGVAFQAHKRIQVSKWYTSKTPLRRTFRSTFICFRVQILIFSIMFETYFSRSFGLTRGRR